MDWENQVEVGDLIDNSLVPYIDCLSDELSSSESDTQLDDETPPTDLATAEELLENSLTFKREFCDSRNGLNVSSLAAVSVLPNSIALDADTVQEVWMKTISCTQRKLKV